MDSSIVGFEIAVVGGLLVGLVSFLVFVKVNKTTRAVGERLEQIEERIRDYRAYSNYLRSQDRTKLRENVGWTLGSLRFLRAFRTFYRKRRRSLIESYYEKTDDLEKFLREFVPQYISRELERHKAFFSGRSFDNQQIEAIVKRDKHNLVIAGAGSGKTRVLTGRVGFLIECGVPPTTFLR